MSFRIPIAVALFACLPACALAAPGINLFLDDCGAGTPVTTVTEFCNSNAGTALVLIGSAVLPGGTIAQFAGTESILDIQTESNVTIPDWWRADACRATGFLATGDPVAIGGSCPTVWDGHPPAGTTLNAVTADGAGPNRIRFLIASTLDAAAAAGASLTSDGATEASVFRLTVTRSRTVGDGACAGCFNPACLVLNEISFHSLGQGPGDWLRLSAAATSRYVTYNGGLTSAVCPDGVPVRTSTWGAIKAFYRR